MSVRLIVAVAVAALAASVAAALLMGGGDGDGRLFGKKDEPRPAPRPEPPPPARTSALTVAAASAGLDPAAATVVVRIDPATGVTVDGTAVADDQLDAVFRRAYEQDPDTQLLLVVAATIPYQQVVTAMDRARTAGLTRIGLSTAADDLADPP